MVPVSVQRFIILGLAGLWVAAMVQLPVMHAAIPTGLAVPSIWSSPSLPYLFTPVKGGSLSSQFGYRTDPIHGRQRLHSGVDIAAPEGTPIVVPQPGVVVYAGERGGYGNVVVIQHHPMFHTLYAHTSKMLVKRGQTVIPGQTIALVGTTGRSTGPHLHFETIVNHQYSNPLDYLAFLNVHPPVHPAQYIATVQGVRPPAITAPYRTPVQAVQVASVVPQSGPTTVQSATTRPTRLGSAPVPVQKFPSRRKSSGVEVATTLLTPPVPSS